MQCASHVNVTVSITNLILMNGVGWVTHITLIPCLGFNPFTWTMSYSTVCISKQLVMIADNDTQVFSCSLDSRRMQNIMFFVYNIFILIMSVSTVMLQMWRQAWAMAMRDNRREGVSQLSDGQQGNCLGGEHGPACELQGWEIFNISSGHVDRYGFFDGRCRCRYQSKCCSNI